jgi:hypothetical protein
MASLGWHAFVRPRLLILLKEPPGSGNRFQARQCGRASFASVTSQFLFFPILSDQITTQYQFGQSSGDRISADNDEAVNSLDRPRSTTRAQYGTTNLSASPRLESGQGSEKLEVVNFFGDNATGGFRSWLPINAN